MKYQVLAEAYAAIERTTSRLQMTALLADLFRATSRDDIARVVYLTQGKLYPDFEGIEIGVAEKTALRAVAQAAGVPEEAVARRLAREGDLGTAAEALLAGHPRRQPTLTVDEVYTALDRAARASGSGAQAARLAEVAGLLQRATPLEARYLVRTVTGKLRLGAGDMTVLDALAEVYGGGRQARAEVERAYNLTSDLGFVAARIARGGLAAVRRVSVVVGKPIRPMLAERLGDAREILQKLGGRCIAEFKYDGERLQIHRQGEEVQIFSRRLERISAQYPDVVALVRTYLKARQAIIEGEVVAVDPDSGELRSFQDLMPRRRKYGIAEAVREIPTALFVFDALYLDGEDLTRMPYARRRAALQRVITTGERFQLAASREVEDPEALQAFFEEAIAEGCEGLLCKAPGGVYQAGARGWLWIKFKREYRSEMSEPVDLVVVGAFHGRGKRAGAYGALLMAACDRATDRFFTVCKVGSGFSDRDLAELPRRLKPHLRSTPDPRVESRLEPDVWCTPELVLEIVGAEITLSPVHTAGWDRFRQGSGLAIRFPRFTGRYREDKGPSDATTVEEIVEMYRRRLRRTA
ncbi:MAG: ATP-dependent DNA ligase [Armatimonadota bacterium]|nr:ATP-dependent DNA ligase [Armatimonadota bacterium]MDR7427154.1 ATP-dependent DNA ligase [Armatimonadota bacterium]MDR7463980.1 ATP-dependent DNA ligase [Armatimonadota bacterium]MDR7470459.1 ATP-dependent DNA ligase [Armatimonadota bacterium]MDR7473563.1 ATP-dependent DNA ligase [Armatimonadota bacterium]